MENEKSKENKETINKLNNCKYSHMQLLSATEFKHTCSKQEYKEITSKDCENCSLYKSKYIEYPITVNEVKIAPVTDNYSQRNCGRYVKIRPCLDNKEEEKTYFGIYLGEVPINNYITYKESTKLLEVKPMSNPAIFVPRLNKIVYGCESWWGFIDSAEDLQDITDKDIASQFYVKLLEQFK